MFRVFFFKFDNRLCWMEGPVWTGEEDRKWKEGREIRWGLGERGDRGGEGKRTMAETKENTKCSNRTSYYIDNDGKLIAKK